jgi:hypothetical protein
MATEHKEPVLIFEADEVLKIVREQNDISDGQLLDAVANYTRIHHKDANADTTRFHSTGLVICDLKPKKGK